MVQETAASTDAQGGLHVRLCQEPFLPVIRKERVRRLQRAERGVLSIRCSHKNARSPARLRKTGDTLGSVAKKLTVRHSRATSVAARDDPIRKAQTGASSVMIENTTILGHAKASIGIAVPDGSLTVEAQAGRPVAHADERTAGPNPCTVESCFQILITDVRTP